MMIRPHPCAIADGIEALLRDPRFRITEVYRSPDCSSWVGTIRFVEDVRDDKNVAHPAN